MFYDDIREKLNKLKDSDKLNPDKQWKQKNKEALLSEIESEKEKSATISEKVASLCDVLFPYRVVAASKMAVFIFLLVFGVIGGWSATVQASYSSVPGDTLYNVKMVAEGAQLTMTKMTGDQAKEAKLHSEFATRRAKEVEKILKNDKDPNKAKKVIKSMNKSIDKAKDSLKRANESGNKDAVNSTQKILNNNEIIKETLSKVLVDMSDGSATLADDIVVVQGKINAGSLQILEYMVRSQLEDKVDLSQEEAKALVINTISALSKNSVDTSNISDSMNKKAIDKITKGVVSKVEDKKGDKIGSGLTRQEDSKQKDKETEESKKKNKEKKKTKKDESEQESSEESETENGQKESSSSTTSTTSTISTTSSNKTGTTTDKSTSSSPETTSSSVSFAKKLAQKGKLLEAIEKAQNISSKNTEQLLKMVKTKVDKEENKVFVELNHEGQIVTSTVEYSQSSTSSDKSTTTEKSKDANSNTSSKKTETTTTEKLKEKDKKKQESTSTEKSAETQDESTEQSENNESNKE